MSVANLVAHELGTGGLVAPLLLYALAWEVPIPFPADLSLAAPERQWTQLSLTVDHQRTDGGGGESPLRNSLVRSNFIFCHPPPRGNGPMPRNTKPDARESQAVALCRELGLKVTRQRIVILSDILSAKDHPSAEVVYQRVKSSLPDLSLDTVYRTLRTLTARGYVRRLSAPLDEARFDPDLRPHRHFVCRQCGRIWDLPGAHRLPRTLAAAVTDLGRLEAVQLTAVGRCRRCMNTRKGNTTP